MNLHTSVALALLVTSGLAAQGQSPQVTAQQTKSLNLSAYAELLRSDVRTQKVAIITEVMGFNEAEDKAFWPSTASTTSRWPSSATSGWPDRGICAQLCDS